MQPSTISKTVHFDAAHRLTQHPGACSNLHGHRWTLEVRLTGRIDPEDGMVEDFGVVSDVADELDHATILNRDDPLVDAVSEVQEPVLLEDDPTSERLIDFIWTLLETRLRDTASVERIRLYETPGSCAERERNVQKKTS